MLGEWDYSRKRKFWGAQAASLFFSAACRKAHWTFLAKDFCGALPESLASCRRLQADSLCSPEAETRSRSAIEHD